ncbi:MAG: ABC transporter ATP-binding protein [Gemmatimonadetes bacterium]|nr:ABC transporter ATP-binding protein [Gemmatimonadota bacterium]MXX73071.1 ABC transporter ATP-binding protein [Gemmatimonadota bacterium]MYC91404.1 ABC transporter ATP-binding protein [Gemmatimonadota bacterium]MYG34144.1 ABC transporter ATP-binding protein [Gemmatimonadota bacterium]MYJ17608.1 ABC transporter ATP-binding protein [Gemmatimonadota bacterium]
MSEIVVAARDLTRDYRTGRSQVRALRGISIDVPHGDFLAVTGPSGSGKSTLLHLLGGVDTPTSGEVVFLGRNLARMSVEERAALRLEQVGLVFQRFHLLPMLTALENVELPLAAARVPRKLRRARAAAVLERVALADRLHHRPGELSGGQCQRVAIARALANEPALVLADEPTGELDRATSRQVLALFQSLNADGTTLVVATHDLELAAGAKRSIEVVDGRVLP